MIIIEFIRRMIDADCLIAPGGLRIRDTSRGIAVNPGCCFGLENWRDWLDVADGGTPWLGHDPSHFHITGVASKG